MSDELSVEATGETVGEAKWAALRELERLAPGLDRDAVRFHVVSEGERGLLGVGYEPARVVAAAPRPEPRAQDAGLSPAATLAREAVERIAAALGVSAGVSVSETGDEVTVTLGGPDVGIVIGRHGQTIDAVQYLVNAIAARRDGPERKHVTVDAGGYRERRTAALERQARESAERAAATGSRVALEPMNAVERKVVHEALKDDPEVTTGSEGAEPNRYVVVVPRHLP